MTPNDLIEIVFADGGAEQAFLARLRRRGSETDARVTAQVAEIIADIRENGDAALLKYTRRFDCETADITEISRAQLDEALKNADVRLIGALQRAHENIRAYHERQKRQSFIDTQENGVILGQRIRALERVGMYVPGGTAAYPSSVLMNAVPAKIAGVKELIMVTPPLKTGGANPDILAAAAIAGVDRVFLIGGAQAVAALALGTQRIPRVDKIVGPGNIYVATAKKLLYGSVDIDMIAGPSEILIIADKNADPRLIAADMLSQAEHDTLASAILLTDSEPLALKVRLELFEQLQTLPRAEMAQESLQNYGGIILCRDMAQMISLSNALAPEHLEVLCENPFALLGKLDNAGSVFLGAYSPEPLGDYYAGPNHVLPTSGTARFFSPLSVDDFIKKSSFIYYTKEALTQASEDIILLAQREGLDAHANSIKVRL